MNVKDLVPKNKFDDTSIDTLKRLSYEEIEPIVPDLLEWLQDMNWPVASEVRDVLTPFIDQLFPEFQKIFTSNDGLWKYWILSCFGDNTTDKRFIDEMKRMAISPTEDEITEEVDIYAREILERRNIVW